MRLPFIVAEIGAAHNGKLKTALDLVDAAADAGADAVKIQCWAVDRMVIDRSYVVEDGPWKGRNLYELYQECRTPWEWIPAIARHADARGIGWFSSVFDVPSLIELERHNCPRYKIASCEITDLPLIRAVRKTGKPIVISTGMADDAEIDDAVAAGGPHLTLLKCAAAYPAQLQDCNLATIPYMTKRFGCDIGFSDHTQGTLASMLAVSAGATMIERHITLSNNDGGPDDGFATDAKSFGAMVVSIKAAVVTMGEVQFGPQESEASTYKLRRSLYYARDISEGQIIEDGDMVSARPALGCPPDAQARFLGKRAPRLFKRGEPVK